jgi:hypothetical protein
MDITNIRKQLDEACEWAKRRGLKISPGFFGVSETQFCGIVADSCGECCPIAALQLLTQKRRDELEFDLDAFIDGFDGDGHELDYEGRPMKTATRNLGIEFRRKYCSVAA